MSYDPVDEVLWRLRQRGLKTLRRDGYWHIQCPGHDDHEPSGTLSRGRDGLALLKCFGPCGDNVDHIAGSLGMSLAELRPDYDPARKNGVHRPPHTAPVPWTPPAPTDGTGLTVAELAAAKGFTLEQLTAFGATDITWQGKRAVGIIYRGVDGKAHLRQRVRTALPAKAGSLWTKAPVPLIPYGLDRLAAARERGALILTEGETDTWTLWANGFPALGLPGARNARLIQPEHLDGLTRLWVCEDADTAGGQFVADIARRLHEIGWTGELRAVRMPDGLKDPNDLYRRDPAAFPETLRAALRLARRVTLDGDRSPSDAAEPVEEPWTAPVEIVLRPRPPFPVLAFPDWLYRFVVEIANDLQVPVDLVAMHALAALAAAVQKKFVVEVRPNLWIEVLGLYVFAPAPPASRKSSVVKAIKKPFTEWEQREAIRLAPEIAAAASVRAIRERERDRLIGDAAKEKDPVAKQRLEDDVASAAAALAVTEEKRPPLILIDDITPESLATQLHEQHGRAALFSAEGGIVSMIAGRYDRGSVPNLDIWLKGHSGEDHRVRRTTRQENIPEATLTLAISPQPSILRDLNEAPAFRERGLLARFLYAITDSLIGQRDPDPPAPPEDVTVPYAAGITWLLNLPWATEGPAGTGPVRSTRLRFTPDAYDLLTDYMGRLEPRLGLKGDLYEIQDWGGKLAGQVVRIAALLHLAEYAGNGLPPLEIPDGPLLKAFAVGDYLIEHALAAFELMPQEARLESVQRLIEAIRKWGKAHFRDQELWQYQKNRYPSKDKLQADLDVLLERGYLRAVPTPRKPGPGRPPAPSYVVNPCLLDGQPDAAPATDPLVPDEPVSNENEEELPW